MVSQVLQRVDAVVLAGTHTDRKKLIRGQNKAFLPVGGEVCLAQVLRALKSSLQIGRIFVVGPKELRRLLPPEDHGYRLIPEVGRMLDNAWAAFQATEDSHRTKAPGEVLEDRPCLFLTSDIPLAVPEAIDDFAERCFALEEKRGERVDFFTGLADEVALAPFYPRPDRRGIRRPYMELRHQRVRLANIYLARPRRIRNLEVLQQGFAARKLTQWRSIGRLIKTFLQNPAGVRAVGHVVCFQTASLLGAAGMERLAAAPRRLLPLDSVERTASMMLGCRFTSVITPYGGLSLDIDDESDYAIIGENLAVWREHQRTLLLPPADRPRAAVAPSPPTTRPAPPPREPAN